MDLFKATGAVGIFQNTKYLPLFSHSCVPPTIPSPTPSLYPFPTPFLPRLPSISPLPIFLIPLPLPYYPLPTCLFFRDQMGMKHFLENSQIAQVLGTFLLGSGGGGGIGEKVKYNILQAVDKKVEYDTGKQM